MLTLGIETIVVLLIIMGAVCAVGGYTYAQARQRRAGGGKTAEELKAELGKYKESVTDHFQTTANLLNGMTEQYRAVYQHMASGAQNLCDPEQASAQIENLAAAALPATIVDPIEHTEAEQAPAAEQDAASVNPEDGQNVNVNAPLDVQDAAVQGAVEDVHAEPAQDTSAELSAGSARPDGEEAVAEADAKDR